MDESVKHHNVNPVLKANVFSKLLFWWLNPLFKTGYVRQLEVDDMYNTVHADQSEYLGNRMHSEWQKEVNNCKDGKRQPSLYRCLFRMFGLEYILFGVVLLMEEATKVIQPLLLGGLIRYLTPNTTVSKMESYLYAMGVSICAIVLATAHHPYFFGVQRIAMKIKIACCHLIYRKAVLGLHFMWIGPLEAIAVFAIIWNELGASTLAGFSILLLMVPIKCGWGNYSQNTEIQGIRSISWLYCVWETMANNGTYLFVYAVLLLFVYTGQHFKSASVYIMISAFNSVRQCVLRFMLGGVKNGISANVPVKRIQTFLALDEISNDNTAEQNHIPLNECGIEIVNITAKWEKAIKHNTIRNVSLSVKTGQLLAVIGPVGAGKSSLLMSILKELQISEGEIKVKGRIAYVDQQPWVFSASLRQNITFGNKFDEVKYDRILKSCALDKDIGVLPNGDSTLIGDRGVILSGGQRARVSLARALYREADVYLLDDPLSAVDASVGRYIFENVIQGILKDKPRILVTHQLQYLKRAEEIIILKEGLMIGKGTFKDLSISGVDFSSLLKRDNEKENEPEHDTAINPETLSHDSHANDSDISIHHSDISSSETGSSTSLSATATSFRVGQVQELKKEERREGTVSMYTYYQYFKAGAGCFKAILCAILCVTAQLACNQEETRYGALDLNTEFLRAGNNVTNVTIPSIDTHFNISVFTGLVIVVFITGILRALVFFKVTVDASEHLHNRMFASLLRSHIGFFDTNPIGRILNRFSKDIGQMDDQLSTTFFDFMQCTLLILGIVVVTGVLNPWVFIPIVPLTILFVIIRRYYIRTSRHIKRLVATTRSPVVSHLSATLLGLHTIRAFGVQDKFIDEFDNHQDNHTEACFLSLATSRWLAIRLDGLCAFFITTVSFGCVLATDSLNAGLVGLSMTYAMTLMGMFQWGVRQSAEVEIQMIAVERVLEYANLPSEAILEADEKKAPPPEWPQEGVIAVIGAGLRYSDKSPEVGIVGRTGAGKTSLITMLIRLVEPTGTILIDNINIQDIGLHDLRKHISIIPHDPVLFTGTLRKNLDPFNNHSDESLWSAITEVQLKQFIEDLPHGLDYNMSEGGANFSVGQRQLICLARALLRNNKILLIDEATANVDTRTDELIQKTIREKFKFCTVLTIAHRLNTIIDSDKLLVLGDGRIAEFDVPYILLQNPNGVLRKLVEQTGKSESKHLLDIANTEYKKQSSNGNIDESDSGTARTSLVTQKTRPEAVSVKTDADKKKESITDGHHPRLNVDVAEDKEVSELDTDSKNDDDIDESTTLLGKGYGF